MAEFFALQPNQIDDYWPWIEPLLRKVKQSEWTPEDVRSELKSSNAQLWGIPGGMWITKIEEVGETKRGLVWIAAGDNLKTGLRYFRTYTESWLKGQGCEYVQILGRKGWLRALPDYRQTAIVLEKRL